MTAVVKTEEDILRHGLFDYQEFSNPSTLGTIWKRNGPATQTIELCIRPELVNRNRKQVKARQLWGDKVYTSDSDVVAALLHNGYVSCEMLQLPERVVEVRVQLKLSAPREEYASSFRNTIRSRSWCSPIQGCSFEIDNCWLLLQPDTEVPPKSDDLANLKAVELSPSVGDGSAITTTFVPSASDRQMSTRSSAGTQRTKAAPEATILYNLCNEPWMKYTVQQVADKGLAPKMWTSARLHNEVLFVETKSVRYQLAFIGVHGEGDAAQELYSWSVCKPPLPASVMPKLGLPLPADYAEVLEDKLRWEEVLWGDKTMRVRDRAYKALRVHFMPVTKQTLPADAMQS